MPSPSLAAGTSSGPRGLHAVETCLYPPGGEGVAIVQSHKYQQIQRFHITRVYLFLPVCILFPSSHFPQGQRFTPQRLALSSQGSRRVNFLKQNQSLHHFDLILAWLTPFPDFGAQVRSALCSISRIFFAESSLSSSLDALLPKPIQKSRPSLIVASSSSGGARKIIVGLPTTVARIGGGSEVGEYVACAGEEGAEWYWEGSGVGVRVKEWLMG